VEGVEKVAFRRKEQQASVGVERTIKRSIVTGAFLWVDGGCLMFKMKSAF
jgi:hypothetical protein